MTTTDTLTAWTLLTLYAAGMVVLGLALARSSRARRLSDRYDEWDWR